MPQLNHLQRTPEFLLSRFYGSINLSNAPGLDDVNPDGSVVVITSNDGNLVVGDNNAMTDVFALDVASRSITRISAGSAGSELGAARNGRISDNR
jgi:hypothetical protein